MNNSLSYLYVALPEDLASISCQLSPVLANIPGPLMHMWKTKFEKMSFSPTLFRKGVCLGTGCLDHELLLLHPGGCSWKGMAIRQGINLSPDILVGVCVLIKKPQNVSNIWTNKWHFEYWATYILHFLKILLASRANHPQYSHRYLGHSFFNCSCLVSEHCVARQGLNHMK